MKTRYGLGDPKAAAVDLMRCFPGSFINQRLELIVHPRTNQYFLLEDCHTGDDVVAKSIEWLSRAAAKGQPYDKERNNRAFREMMQQGLNEFWGTNFTEEDFLKIYQHLGNAVNHEKTMRFVRSGFDMQELEVSYGATGTDNPV